MSRADASLMLALCALALPAWLLAPELGEFLVFPLVGVAFSGAVFAYLAARGGR